MNLTENVLSEDYVREIVNRKKAILTRRENNEDEIRESIRDMEECDRIIEGWQSTEIEELRAEWNIKLSEFESWHEMMQQVEVLSQTIQTRLDVTVIQTIWILKERSYDIKHSELGGTLRESLEQLATTSETSVNRHLQNLELSNEQDCPDAIEFLEVSIVIFRSLHSFHSPLILYPLNFFSLYLSQPKSSQFNTLT